MQRHVPASERQGRKLPDKAPSSGRIWRKRRRYQESFPDLRPAA